MQKCLLSPVPFVRSERSLTLNYFALRASSKIVCSNTSSGCKQTDVCMFTPISLCTLSSHITLKTQVSSDKSGEQVSFWKLLLAITLPSISSDSVTHIVAENNSGSDVLEWLQLQNIKASSELELLDVSWLTECMRAGKPVEMMGRHQLVVSVSFAGWSLARSSITVFLIEST